ncbi:MAG: hypothetical protein QW292_00805, partial [Candidatus Parvarchaeota archaeon]
MARKKGTRTLNKILSNIKTCSDDEDYAVVVEGKRDRDALIKAGINKNRIIVSAYKNIDQILNEIKNYRGAIILYDFDRTGRFKARYLSSVASSEGIKVNDFYISTLKDMGIVHVEEIGNRMDDL